jgi:peptidyl-prolyl cis-trans isomerase A (cyclophilin A)
MVTKRLSVWLAVLIYFGGMLLLGCADEGTEPKDAELPVVGIEVTIDTMRAQFQIELYPEKAPATVENFLKYVDDRFYDGTIFHRIIAGFIIQGGGYTEGMVPVPPTYPAIPLEARNGLRNLRGTIAMARTSQPNSATSQFFINLRDNPNLDYPKPDGHGYAVFGAVTQGLDVVDSIATVPTGPMPPHQNVPLKPIIIEEIRRLSASG